MSILLTKTTAVDISHLYVQSGETRTLFTSGGMVVEETLSGNVANFGTIYVSGVAVTGTTSGLAADMNTIRVSGLVATGPMSVRSLTLTSGLIVNGTISGSIFHVIDTVVTSGIIVDDISADAITARTITTSGITVRGGVTASGVVYAYGGLSTPSTMSASLISASGIFTGGAISGTTLTLTSGGGVTIKKATYIIDTDGTYYYAYNGRTGALDYGGPTNAGGASGTYAEVVINNALANRPSGLGGVDFRRGTYGLISSIIINTDATNLEGEARAAVTFTCQSGGDMISLELSSGQTQLQRIGIRKLKFEGATASRYGITSHNLLSGSMSVRNLTVEDCEFNSFNALSSVALNVKNIESSWFRDNRFVYGASGGILVRFYCNGYHAGNVIFEGNTLQSYVPGTTFLAIDAEEHDFTNMELRQNLYETHTTDAQACTAVHLHGMSGSVGVIKCVGERIEDFSIGYDILGTAAANKYASLIKIDQARIWSDSYSGSVLVKVGTYTFQIDVHDSDFTCTSGLQGMIGVSDGGGGVPFLIHDNAFTGFGGTNSRAVSGTATTTIYNNYGYVTEKTGTLTVSGSGAATAFMCSHGLVSTPTELEWKSKTPDSVGDAWWSGGLTTATINFITPPISGTNNVVLSWRAKV